MTARLQGQARGVTVNHIFGVQTDSEGARARQRADCQSKVSSGLSGNTSLWSVACVITSNQEVISYSESDGAQKPRR